MTFESIVISVFLCLSGFFLCRRNTGIQYVLLNIFVIYCRHLMNLFSGSRFSNFDFQISIFLFAPLILPVPAFAFTNPFKSLGNTFISCLLTFCFCYPLQVFFFMTGWK